MKRVVTERPNRSRFFSEGDMILDIRTSTRFWRSSQILEADIMTAGKDSICETQMISEKESDEYDILLELAESLKKAGRIYTFNGTSFDMPHLAKKFAAYRVNCSTEKMKHIDLMHEFRKYGKLLPITSHRLSDYYALVTGRQQEVSDAEALYDIMSLYGLHDFVSGSFEILSFGHDTDEKIFRFTLKCDLPCRILNISDYCTLRGFSGRAELLVRVENGNLRVYHTDPQNYDFLPIEGYAVHKSLAGYIAASRKIPATRENCYTYIPVNEKFTGDTGKITKYIVSLLNSLLN